LRRFEADPSCAVEFAAQVAFRFGPARPGVARSFRLSIPSRGKSPPAVAAAMSGALEGQTQPVERGGKETMSYLTWKLAQPSP
jgi:hypothetical protein